MYILIPSMIITYILRSTSYPTSLLHRGQRRPTELRTARRHPAADRWCARPGPNGIGASPRAARRCLERCDHRQSCVAFESNV